MYFIKNILRCVRGGYTYIISIYRSVRKISNESLDRINIIILNKNQYIKQDYEQFYKINIQKNNSIIENSHWGWFVDTDIH